MFLGSRLSNFQHNILVLIVILDKIVFNLNRRVEKSEVANLGNLLLLQARCNWSALTQLLFLLSFAVFTSANIKLIDLLIYPVMK